MIAEGNVGNVKIDSVVYFSIFLDLRIWELKLCALNMNRTSPQNEPTKLRDIGEVGKYIWLRRYTATVIFLFASKTNVAPVLKACLEDYEGVEEKWATWVLFVPSKSDLIR